MTLDEAIKQLKRVTLELEEHKKKNPVFYDGGDNEYIYALQEENKILKEKNNKLQDFVRACRLAGPGGVEKLREDAVKLCDEMKS